MIQISEPITLEKLLSLIHQLPKAEREQLVELQSNRNK